MCRLRRPFSDAPWVWIGCILLTKGLHWVRFPAGAPHPRVGLLMACHRRFGGPAQRASSAPRAGVQGDPGTPRLMNIRGHLCPSPIMWGNQGALAETRPVNLVVLIPPSGSCYKSTQDTRPVDPRSRRVHNLL
jgi:hypothetical protein